jgi:hypothetical protein
MDDGLAFLSGVLAGVSMAFLAIFRTVAQVHAGMERRVR